MPLSRRTLLQAVGLAALPQIARAGSPSAAWSAAAHRRLADAPRILAADERATIAAVADAILPRTDTPGALDVDVPAFIELLLAEWLAPADRDALRTGIADLDAHAVATHAAAWPALSAEQRSAEIAWGEERATPLADGQRAFRRLKGWIVHGWFTSERVHREVLRTNIVPGSYSGCTPVPGATGGADA